MLRWVFLLVVFVFSVGFISFGGGYRDHYQLTGMRVDLLGANGKTTYNETILKAVDVITEGQEFYVHFVFACRFFASGEETNAYPLHGSKGPTDTIDYFHLKSLTNDTSVQFDSLVNYPVD